MNRNFEANTIFDYKFKILTEKVKSFESGEKYIVMASEFKKKLRAKDREINRLKQELEGTHRQIITNRKHWEEATEDLEKEHSKLLKKKDHEINKMEKRALKAETALDVEKDKLHDKTKDLYQVKTELEEEKEKNKKLKAQINRDYENSSIPSSMKINRKKISNNREKTGKKPGGQPGHKGHGRKKLPPTKTIDIAPPDEYINNPDFKETEEIIKKQMIDIYLCVDVIEYSTPEFRNTKTGQRVHAKFPKGFVNDVNYGGSVKSFAFLLNNQCNVSIDKVREFLSELTEGKLQISKGMISGLSKEFSRKTEVEQKKSFSDLLLSPVMNVDFTNSKLNGKNVQVAICATPGKALYFAREHKGHKGVKDTPLEDYQGIAVHDHDKTFYNYGADHQECLVHVLRYLKSSMENEPSLNWNKRMRELIREMIHYRKNLNPGDFPEKDKIIEFEDEYLRILETAKDEYEYEPPSKYNREGFNLYKRLEEYMANHLLFLHDIRIPADNNSCERLARVFKRKLRQIMTFRSFDSMGYFCNSLSMLYLLTVKNENLYYSAADIFERRPAFG
jgi:hypothetical protein